MPDMGVGEAALIASIIGGATATAGIGTSIYEGDKSATAAKDSQAAALQNQNAQTDAAKVATTKSQAANINQMMPGLQSNTGGATTPEYNASVGGSSSGTGDPNVIQQAITSFLGQNPNGLAAGSGGGSPTTPGGGTNMFPNAAVPAFAGLQQGGSDTGLSGGSQ